MPITMQCAPAFNYAQDSHQTTLINDETTVSPQKKALFQSDGLSLELRYVADSALVCSTFSCTCCLL